MYFSSELLLCNSFLGPPRRKTSSCRLRGDARAMAHAEALDRLARLVARAVKCDHAVIISLGGVGGRASVVDERAHGMLAHGDEELLSHPASLFRRVREAREPLAVLDARGDDVAREWSPVTEGAVRSFIGMALVAPVQDGGADAGVVGVVGAYCCRPRSAPFEALELEAFRLTCELIAEKLTHQQGGVSTPAAGYKG